MSAEKINRPVIDTSAASEQVKDIKAPVRNGRVKVSAHLVESNLKPWVQIDMFETSTDQKKAALEFIDRNGVGWDLTGGELTLLWCLRKLLHDKSQNINPALNNYYTGNFDLIKHSKSTGINYDLTKHNEKFAALTVTIHELAKEYSGSNEPSGRHYDIVKKTLVNLADNPEKKCLIKYTQKRDGLPDIHIERQKNLIEILKVYEGDAKEQDKTWVIILDPIYREQIERKAVFYPNNFIERLRTIEGGNISETIHKLFDYFVHQLSNKVKTQEFYSSSISLEYTAENKPGLYYRIGLYEKYIKTGRKKRAKEQLISALATASKTGILLSYEIKANVKGGEKLNFTLNPNWIDYVPACS